jgi:hypothetical protein
MKCGVEIPKDTVIVKTYFIKKDINSNTISVGDSIKFSLEEWRDGSYYGAVRGSDITRFNATPNLGSFSRNGDFIVFTALKTGTTAITMDYRHGEAIVSETIIVIP